MTADAARPGSTGDALFPASEVRRSGPLAPSRERRVVEQALRQGDSRRAAILYELLTGQLPFDLSGLTPAEAATVITEHEPGKPSAAVKRNAGSVTNSRFLSLGKTEWADLDGDTVVWAEGGCLHRARLLKSGIGAAKVLFDFNPLKFEAREAPY